MANSSVIRRIAAVALVVTLSLVGVPRPAHAADEETSPLTFNGRPLSELLNRRATRDPWPQAAPSEQPDGQIGGVLLDEDGLPLTDRRVELDRPTRMWEGRLVTTTDASGSFLFVGLGPGRYEVQYRVERVVVATSGPIHLATGTMLARGVRLSLASEKKGWWGRRSAPEKVAIAVGASYGAAVLVFLALYGLYGY